MFVWPSRAEVDEALRAWAPAAVAQHPATVRLGCFGSYCRRDWGVGSDLDLVAVVDFSDKPFERRSADWNLHALPVPAELLVYTEDEWRRLQGEGGRFAATMAHEAKWLYVRP
ncbi:MAG: nucleotidyltransferase domain-containing protein [Thermoguttaceae bacterium]